MKKLLLYFVLVLIVIFAAMVYNYTNHITIPSGDPSAPQPWQPAQLRIPHIHIDALVINVGATASGAMDALIPKAIHSPY